jgi:hypothetical protein
MGNGANREASIADLIREALDESRALVKAEAVLARDEIQKNISEVKVSLGTGVAAIQIGLLGLWMVSIGAVLWLFPKSPIATLIVGLVFLLIAGLIGLVSYTKRPKHPLQETLDRLNRDIKLIREGVS